MSKKGKDDLQRHNIPFALINAASFVHPKIPAARWKLNSDAVLLNIQGFPPSTSISQACVKVKPVLFVQQKSTRQNTDVS